MKRFYSIFFVVVYLFVFSVSSFAISYDNNYPSSVTQLTGGKFIRCYGSVGEIIILLPEDKANYLTVTSSGNLINLHSSTINGRCYINNVSYLCRFTSFNSLEYRIDNNNYYTYVEIVIDDIIDTNCDLITNKQEYYNNSFYFSKFEIFVICLLICILIFVFLGWLKLMIFS